MINGELRRKNAEKIASFAKQTSPEMLWRGTVFHDFANNAVESAFADHRTYIYKGKEVDKQVHLGFDLASFTGTPIVAANRGKVLFADELGIYGNCVIIDHGMGVQSLYGHLSSIEVKAGQDVEKEQSLGRSGMTGLAGGDHLHFTMLVNGHMVNPVEWWDAHWIEDRILRKLRRRPARERLPEIGRESWIIFRRDADSPGSHQTRDADLADHHHTGRGSRGFLDVFVLLSRV